MHTLKRIEVMGLAIGLLIAPALAPFGYMASLLVWAGLSQHSPGADCGAGAIVFFTQTMVFLSCASYAIALLVGIPHLCRKRHSGHIPLQLAVAYLVLLTVLVVLTGGPSVRFTWIGAGPILCMLVGILASAIAFLLLSERMDSRRSWAHR